MIERGIEREREREEEKEEEREREGEKESERDIYIYIYIYREREIEMFAYWFRMSWSECHGSWNCSRCGVAHHFEGFRVTPTTSI